MSKCVECYKIVTLGDGFTHTECNHTIHYECVDDSNNPNFEVCASCRGKTQKPKLPIKEIVSFNGRDYIREPVEGAVCSADIERLLADKPTIEEIVLGENLHLQHLLHNGVTIDTFLKNGYTWDDLVKFNDLSKPGERRVDTLYALYCTAEHFRDYPNELPVKKMGITSKNIISHFGLAFGEDYGELCVIGSKNDRPWSMDDLVKLGVKADDLYQIGLYTLAQFDSLGPTEENVLRVGFTQKQVDELYPPIQRRQFVRNNDNNNNNTHYDLPPVKDLTISVFENVRPKKKRHGLRK